MSSLSTVLKDLQEAAAAATALPVVIDLVKKIEAGVAGLPSPRTGAAYGALVASVAPELGQLIDTIEADVKSA